MAGQTWEWEDKLSGQSETLSPTLGEMQILVCPTELGVGLFPKIFLAFDLYWSLLHIIQTLAQSGASEAVLCSS